MSAPQPALRVFTVPGISCQHCKTAIDAELAHVTGVTAYTVDIDTT